ncbi:MAG TPA: hypothetical protein PKH75_10030 [Bacillota bacterium]|jgi:hypothetical protein|nr:hypothetical protein [Bacillota bacterium]
MTRAEELRAEAAALQRRAAVLVAVADVADAVHDASDGVCPGGPCTECPAHVGHPGICLFVRLCEALDAVHWSLSTDPKEEV